MLEPSSHILAVATPSHIDYETPTANLPTPRQYNTPSSAVASPNHTSDIRIQSGARPTDSHPAEMLPPSFLLSDYQYAPSQEVNENYLGPKHPSTLNNVNAMGLMQFHGGKYEEAEVIYQRAYGERENTLGEEHPDTLTSILAATYWNQGRWKETEELDT